LTENWLKIGWKLAENWPRKWTIVGWKMVGKWSKNGLNWLEIGWKSIENTRTQNENPNWIQLESNSFGEILLGENVQINKYISLKIRKLNLLLIDWTTPQECAKLMNLPVSDSSSPPPTLFQTDLSLLAQLIHSFTTKSDGNFHRKTNSKSLERSERRRNVFQVELFLIVERPARNLPCSSGLLSLGNQKLVSTGILRAGELVPSAIYPRQRQRLSLPIAVPIARAMGARMGRAWSRQCHLAPGKCTGSAEVSTRGGGRCRGQRRRPHRGLNAPLPNEFQSFFFENELMIIILKLIPGFSGLFENVFLCDSSTRNWT